MRSLTLFLRSIFCVFLAIFALNATAATSVKSKPHKQKVHKQHVSEYKSTTQQKFDVAGATTLKTKKQKVTR